MHYGTVLVLVQCHVPSHELFGNVGCSDFSSLAPRSEDPQAAVELRKKGSCDPRRLVGGVQRGCEHEREVGDAEDAYEAAGACSSRTGLYRERLAGAAALEFQHRQPAIMERINAFFGFRAVRQLRLKQASIADISPKTEKRRMSTPVKVRSTRTTQNIEDGELRLALDRLASRIAPRDRSDIL